eukprot:CAMPEP_0185823604 /NCGR_PEP_ID=MMETSP1322-20130828/28441_1 /TAXON_ID=265543 /ORGANISM="Minutocellus polymorphus, Strain RCC2270" /LENGTH=121 /DNA_ID=CAMNT_0028521161 /DNA_START=163 /DNA_END=528 /DNA_ORIENTATION=-
MSKLPYAPIKKGIPIPKPYVMIYDKMTITLIVAASQIPRPRKNEKNIPIKPRTPAMTTIAWFPGVMRVDSQPPTPAVSIEENVDPHIFLENTSSFVDGSDELLTRNDLTSMHASDSSPSSN